MSIASETHRTTAAIRAECISRCRTGVLTFIRSSVERDSMTIPTAVTGQIIGVSATAVVLSSAGGRTVVLALSTVREVADAPAPLPMTMADVEVGP